MAALTHEDDDLLMLSKNRKEAYCDEETAHLGRCEAMALAHAVACFEGAMWPDKRGVPPRYQQLFFQSSIVEPVTHKHVKCSVS
jgi:hypothetical protein